jgi:ferrous iron transport protein B
MHSLNIGLVGNPNCGKTTLFNALTGSDQRVGNWPGVTVERKSGEYFYQGEVFNIVDLPGIYSLNVHTAGASSGAAPGASLDEQIACEAIVAGQCDLIINVIDATNLERNLYLTTQLLEMRKPIILAVNMIDIAKRRNLQIDIVQLAQQLQCPVIPIIANKKRGIKDLKEAIMAIDKQLRPQTIIPFPEIITKTIDKLAQEIGSQFPEFKNNGSWLALRLLEDDKYAQDKLKNSSLIVSANTERKKLETILHEEMDIVIADVRYHFIQQLLQTIIPPTTAQTRSTQSFSSRLDNIVLNRILGMPIFFAVMYCLFLFTINLGGALQDFFDIASNTLFVNAMMNGLTLLHSPNWLTAILANGLGKGINTTLSFTPIIACMFFFLTFLEDSGYMARAAFVMDKLMQTMGLPGKSFVPMIIGFGCNVPAIMATRTLENKRDRILTALMSPFMSCGARLTIYVIFASAFFPTSGQNIIFLLYLIGVVVAIITGLVLCKSFLIGESTPFIMELPPYHLPQIRVLLRHTWSRLKKFLWNAGKIIIPVCILIGTLNSITLQGDLSTAEADENTLLAAVGRSITPVFFPLGIQQDNWPATVGLVTGILAKEVVVGTLNTLYSQTSQTAAVDANALDFKTNNPSALINQIGKGFKAALESIPANLANLTSLGATISSPLATSTAQANNKIQKDVYGEMSQKFDGQAGAFAYLLFILLYMPCVSTLAVIAREVGRSWAIFSLIWSTSIAYGASVICYQIATFSAHSFYSSSWIIMICLLWLSTFFALSLYVKRNGLNQARAVG